jgi:hypothetical protein
LHYPSALQQRCHEGEITIKEGEYGEQEIHLVADNDTTQTDVCQGVVGIEKKLDKAGEEKHDRDVED